MQLVQALDYIPAFQVQTTALDDIVGYRSDSGIRRARRAESREKSLVVREGATRQESYGLQLALGQAQAPEFAGFPCFGIIHPEKLNFLFGQPGVWRLQHPVEVWSGGGQSQFLSE